MKEMFKNYPQPEDYTPNNYPKCCCKRPVEIMAGETAEHTFEVPFNVEEECDLVEVIYKLGLEPVVIKNSDMHLEIIVLDNGMSLVTCTLNPNETLLFKTTALSANVQLKFYMKNRSVIYSEVYKVRLLDSLDLSNRPQPVPEEGAIADLPGFSYTED